jgi:hypothetical protein
MSEQQQPRIEGAVSKPPAARPAHIGFRRFSTVEFLIALVLMFVVSPFVEEMKHGKFIEVLLMSLVLVSAVLAVGRNRRTLVVATVLVLPALVGRWLHHCWPEQVSPAVFLSCALVFILFVIFHLLRFILRASRVNREVLCAGISAYLLCGLLWTLAYVLVGKLIPDSFSFSTGPASSQVMEGSTAFYFSFITLTTVGYGDIVPVSQLARMLAALEAMTGTLYLAVFISRLVALYSSEDSQG